MGLSVPTISTEKRREYRLRHHAKKVSTTEGREAHRAKAREAMRRWYHSKPENKAKVAVYRKKWRRDNLEWSNLCKSLLRYGISIDQYHSMNERQDFVCGICRSDRTLVIDHSHDTGKVRGLLCVPCNTGIGSLRESSEIMASAMAYIARAA